MVGGRSRSRRPRTTAPRRRRDRASASKDRPAAATCTMPCLRITPINCAEWTGHVRSAATVRPMNGSTVGRPAGALPAPPADDWPVAWASCGSSARRFPAPRQKASGGEPAVEGFDEFGHSEDLVAADPLSDVGVRLTGHEVDETEQLVERRVGVHQRSPERGARRERAAWWAARRWGLPRALVGGEFVGEAALVLVAVVVVAPVGGWLWWSWRSPGVVVSVGRGIASARRCGVPQGRRGFRCRPCGWDRVATERSEACLTRTGGAGFIAAGPGPVC